MPLKMTAAALGLAAIAASAQAHIVLSPDVAPPGSYYAGVFRVAHGCGGAATTALRVTMPPGVVVAKPQPKPGWTLKIERQALPAPVATEGGGVQRDRVGAITWTGRLPDEEFDTFGLSIKAPAQSGPLYFPAVQTCESGETRWTDIPAPGQAWHAVPHPAPVLTLTGPAPMAGMEHP